MAIDGRHHGERSAEGKGSAAYDAAIVEAWHSGGYPFYYDTVWDVMRLVDYLETRDDVDAKRIGLTGISKGGIETYLTAAVDTRIAAAVPCIGVKAFVGRSTITTGMGALGQSSPHLMPSRRSPA